MFTVGNKSMTDSTFCYLTSGREKLEVLVVRGLARLQRSPEAQLDDIKEI